MFKHVHSYDMPNIVTFYLFKVLKTQCINMQLLPYLKSEKKKIPLNCLKEQDIYHSLHYND